MRLKNDALLLADIFQKFRKISLEIFEPEKFLSTSGLAWQAALIVISKILGRNKCFITSYNEKSKEGCFLETDIQYPENLHKSQDYLPFLPENWKD